MRLSAIFAAVLTVSACSTASETSSVGGATVSTTSSTAGLSGPVGSLQAGVGSFAVTAPPPEDLQAQAMFGPWTLARLGDPVCTVDLGSRNAVGDYTAKTRRCATVDLARIALWTRVDDGLILFDFERRPVVALRPTGPGAYEGVLPDGTRLTLWR